LKHFRHDEEAYVPVAMAVITMLVVFGYGAYRLNNAFTGEKLRVAIVQGSIPQAQKWDSNFAGMIMSRYEDLTKKSAEQKPDLVIWPETSIPGFVENEEELASRVKRLVQEIKTPLLAGSPRYEEANGADSYYNSAFLFLKDGSLGGRYDKLHLVPFGEYVPLRGLFFFVHKFAPRPIGDFTAGKDFTIFRISLERAIKNEDYSWKLVKKVTFSTLICFEDIFPELARNFAKKGASFLVNITNDGWFGRSAAAYQHAQASVFRAVENRINVLRAANTGLSCFIDQKGRITSRVKEDGKDLFVSGFVAADVVLSRAKTIYTVYGDIFAYACMVFTAVCLVLCYKNVGSVSHEA
jgi:apolipoprotein N-acyltransferase